MTGLYRDPKHFYSWNGNAAVPSITTSIGMLAKPALVGWATRETAKAAVRNIETVYAMTRESPPLEEQLSYHPAVAYLKAMPGYQRDSAADVGTRAHKFAELLPQGKTSDIDDDIMPFAESFLRDFIEKYKPSFHPLYTEAMVFHPGDEQVLSYGGTMDTFCRIDDATWLIDYKTSKSGVYPETAMQLAAGRWAGWIGRPGDPKQYDVPKVDRCGALWLRPEGAELIPYDVTPAEFEAFAACRRLWQWVNERAKEVKP